MAFVQLLESLKKTKDKDLFVVSFPDGTEVFFILPAYKEIEKYNKLLYITNNQAIKDIIYQAIFDRYVQNKTELQSDNNLPAGIINSIVEVIFLLSGCFVDDVEYTKTLIDLYRRETSTLINFMKRIICSAFNGYTFPQLDLLNYQDLVYTFIQAERALIEHGIIQEEYNLFVEDKKQKKTTTGDMIQEDLKAWDKFNNENVDKTKNHNLRQKLLERAKRQEQEFRSRQRR